MNSTDRFDHLVNDHILPLVESITAASGLPAKVAWSNAASIIDNVADIMMGRGDLVQNHGVRALGELLKTSEFPDGTRNMLWEPIRITTVNSTAMRKRRICSLHYLIADPSLCKTYPLAQRPVPKQ